jgi:peroxin-3
MERVRRFWSRHRRGLAITAAVAGAGYLAYTYLREKLREASEASSTERSDQEKYRAPNDPLFHAPSFSSFRFVVVDLNSLRRRFIQNQQDCMFTVLALYPNMAQQILEELRVEPILLDLQQKRVATTVGTSSVKALSASDEGDTAARASMITTVTTAGEQSGEGTVLVSQKKSKIELWNELKILSPYPSLKRRAQLDFCLVVLTVLGLVRTLTLIYSLSALVLLSRIQFNLLGRQAYVASILALAPESQTGEPAVQQIRLREEHEIGDLELQRSFLSFSWWLVHRGWKSIMARVHDATEEVFLTYPSSVPLAVHSALGGCETDVEGSRRKRLSRPKGSGLYLPASAKQ